MSIAILCTQKKVLAFVVQTKKLIPKFHKLRSLWLKQSDGWSQSPEATFLSSHWNNDNNLACLEKFLVKFTAEKLFLSSMKGQ